MTENELNPSLTESIRINNEEDSSNKKKYRDICLTIGNHLLLIIYQVLSDNLICRLLACIFTLQAAIIWLGCKLKT